MHFNFASDNFSFKSLYYLYTFLFIYYRCLIYIYFFLFLNHPASLVSLGIDTDRDTLDDFPSSDLPLRAEPRPPMRPPPVSGPLDDSSRRRSELEANFFSFVMVGWIRRPAEACGGGLGGLPAWLPI